MPKSKSKPSSPAIDPSSDAIALAYVGPGHVSGVPARDLDGGDLAYLSYRRANQAALEAEGPHPDNGEAIAHVDAIADELVASGFYSRDVPRETAEPTEPTEPSPTDEQPADPAEEPEV